VLKSNVIILTGGLSGSSVLAGTIAKKDYWLGDNTEKINYQTFENSQLVKLNIELLHKSGYSWDDVMDIPSPSINSLREIDSVSCTNRCKDFVHECNNNKPWIWKDPRLCYTIFFWYKLLNIKSCKFILVERDIKQSWTGIVLRGKTPISFENMKIIENNCIKYSNKFFHEVGVNFLNISFDELILHPEKTIKKINNYLSINLSLKDFQAIYKGSLYKLRWTTLDFYKARMKYCYYKFIKRDATHFPRKREGRGSGWYHLQR